MIDVSIEIKRDLPKDQLKKWQDKVIYSMAREVLDFTDSKSHFPRRTGDLQITSKAVGVLKLGNASYGLDYDHDKVPYAIRVWNMGDGTHWTNDNTLPQWYASVFDKYKTEIVQLAIKNSESELK